MNILTFDLEEWFLEKNYFGNRQEKYQAFDLYLNQILDKLEREQKKATFFCLGGMAREFPEVVRRIADKGHEIGCHSDQHVWITKLTEEEFRTDTISAIDALEQCIGEKVLSYRAPAFSIGNSNKWAFEILAECGIERDFSGSSRFWRLFCVWLARALHREIRGCGNQRVPYHHGTIARQRCGLFRWWLFPFLSSQFYCERNEEIGLCNDLLPHR